MTVVEPFIPAPRPKRWTKAEYFDLVEHGVFARQNLFLFRGELIEMPAMGALHAIAATNVEDWLHDIFRPEFRVRIQKPFELPDQSVPEPDGAVVTHEQADRRPHPNAAVLIIEIADSSIELDRDKAVDYASAGVMEYWLLNARDRNLEIYREPISDSTTITGFRFRTHQVVREGGSIAALIRPDHPVKVSTFLTR